MSKHIQIESNLSITGSNADLRIPLSTNDQKLFLAHLYDSISGNNSQLKKLPEALVAKLDYVTAELLSKKSESVVLCGIDDVNAHLLCNRINDILKSSVVNKSKVSYVRNGSDTNVNEVIDNIINGKVKGCLLYTSPSPRDRTRSRMPSSA